MIIKKLLFIDTNIFIKCITQESKKNENLDFLENLNKKIANKTFLFVPENIKKEVEEKIFEKFKNFEEITIKASDNFGEYLKKNLKQNNVPTFIGDIIAENKKQFIKKIKKQKKESENIFHNIIENKNTKKQKITEKLLLKGVQRAVLKIPPYSPKNNYITHQDCIAFECLLSFYKKNKIEEIIIVSNDKDYYDNDNKIIKKEISKEFKTAKIKHYSNPLEMYNEEFKKEYSPKEVFKFEKTLGIPCLTAQRTLQEFCSSPALSEAISANKHIQDIISHILSDAAVNNLSNFFNPTAISCCPNCGRPYTSEEQVCPNCKTKNN